MLFLFLLSCSVICLFVCLFYCGCLMFGVVFMFWFDVCDYCLGWLFGCFGADWLLRLLHCLVCCVLFGG